MYLSEQLLCLLEVVPGLLVGRLVSAALLEENTSQVIMHLKHPREHGQGSLHLTETTF